ncbi:putative ATP-dependent RNA helicase DHR1 [Saitozyma podzolica]|uniref:RNA helicase n=1 Tax=Saitozyma podzolica TaxID=1890683 RepID=A0A427YP95_9TREE|nr:putative ATP-dependent RNA helicase DHR1 [Saitozyma podzolica]
MPPPKHERYNAKARGSVAGGSAHKKRKRPSTKSIASEHEDAAFPAGAEVAFSSGAGRLAREHGLEVEQGMSSKKKKRLDSYIAKKLKSEARLKTMQRLAALAPSTSTSASLLSSASLGQNPLAPTSAKQRADTREDRLVRRGIERIRRRDGAGSGDEGSDSSGGGVQGDGSGEDKGGERSRRGGKGKGKERAVEVVRDGNEDMATQVAISEKKHKAKKAKKATWNPNLLATQPQSDSSDFDSSDSAYDSPSEAGPSSRRVSPAAPSPPLASTTLVPSAPAAPAPQPDTGIATVANTDADAAAADVKPPPGSALKIPSALASFGSALKRSAGGTIVQPRVVPRRSKPVFGRRGRIEMDMDADEGEDEDGEDSDVSEDEGDDDDESEDDEDMDADEGDDEDDDEDDDGSDEEDSGEEEEDEDEDDEDDDGAESAPPTKKRALGFKEWALKQMGQGLPAAAPDLLSSTARNSAVTIPRDPASGISQIPTSSGPFVGPLGATLAIPSSSLLDQSKRPGSGAGAVDSAPFSVSSARPAISRRPSVAEARMELPILAEEQPIIEAIRMYPVVVICGETGSGKTTQVPQMLYEAGFGFKDSDNPGMIAITQPRRVAAVSLATRVKSELNLQLNSSVVAHQIRYSSTTSPDTAIKFMTDGVLLRELASDFLLSRYSVVVVDEAHERGVNTDVLIGVLSRVAKLREKRWREHTENETATGAPVVRPLRIVIMSATLRVSDFTANPTLFPTPPPIIHIGARQHPVTTHFNRRTLGDYVTEAYKKVCKIHARLPPGGVLVFLTGQAEIQALCRKLEKKYGKKDSKEAAGSHGGKMRGRNSGEEKKQVVQELQADDREAEDVELGHDEDLAADVDDGDAESDPEALDSDDDEEALAELGIDEASDVPMHVLPLYSLLPNDQQMLVFRPPPEGHRLVIVSTNVAETSLTIPGIRYVVDSGRSKERTYDHSTGVQSFKVGWISKASAAQRAGRAGRTGPGHCYRLYSSALFEDHFQQFAEPEILRMPIEGVVLQMKAMAIDQVVNFPFPTPPDRQALRKAEQLLSHLGALEAPTNTRMINGAQQVGSAGGRITDLGKAMAAYPVSPRFAKMLSIGSQHGCLPYVIAIVACLSVGDPFIHEQSVDAIEEDNNGHGDGDDSEVDEVDKARRAELAGIKRDEVRAREERKDVRKRFFGAQSAFMALGNGASDMFKMLAAVGAYEYEPTPGFCAKNFLRAKAMQEIHQLRAQLSAIAGSGAGTGTGTGTTSRTALAPPSDTQLKVLRQILTSAFIDSVAVRLDVALKKGSSFTSCRNVPYRAAGLGSEHEVFIHPSSALFHRAPPDFVVFTEITQSQGRGEGRGKAWLRGVTKINPTWLATLGKGMCTFSRPVEMAMTGKPKSGSGLSALGNGLGGKDDTREVIVVPHFSDLGVDLPAVKRKQRREGTRWVMVE